MKKIELRKIGILKRVLNSSLATSLAKAFRSISSETLDGSDSQGYSMSSTGPHLHYDEQKRIRLQLPELEQRNAEAIHLARRRTFT